MKFANIYLKVEHLVFQDINTNFLETGLKDGCYSLYSIDLDLITNDVEICGYDRIKGEDFVIFYDYHKEQGLVKYLNGVNEHFKHKGDAVRDG